MAEELKRIDKMYPQVREDLNVMADYIQKAAEVRAIFVDMVTAARALREKYSNNGADYITQRHLNGMLYEMINEACNVSGVTEARASAREFSEAVTSLDKNAVIWGADYDPRKY